MSEQPRHILAEGQETTRDAAPRYTRRVSDKILIAFHHACDLSDFQVAEQLLELLEIMLTRRPPNPDGRRRRDMESLVAAHERLWHLRHPTGPEDSFSFFDESKEREAAGAYAETQADIQEEVAIKAFDTALNHLLAIGERATKAAARRGDEIDAVLAEIRTVRKDMATA